MAFIPSRPFVAEGAPFFGEGAAFRFEKDHRRVFLILLGPNSHLPVIIGGLFQDLDQSFVRGHHARIQVDFQTYEWLIRDLGALWVAPYGRENDTDLNALVVWQRLRR